MATDTQEGAQTRSGGRRRAAPAAEKPQDAKTTSYVVLEQVEVRGVRVFDQDDPRAAIGPGQPKQETFVAWRAVGGEDGKPKVFIATTDEKAVEQHTGKGKDAKVGVWKPVSLRSWRGVVEVDPPEEVLEDRRKARDDL